MNERLNFYFKNKITVHIVNNNEQFYNGLIIEISDKHLILLDRVLGEVFIDYREIKIIEPYKKNEE